MSRIIYLGAPEKSSLHWDDSELYNELLPVFVEAAEGVRNRQSVIQSQNLNQPVKWRRLLPLTASAKRSGGRNGEAAFFTINMLNPAPNAAPTKAQQEAMQSANEESFAVYTTTDASFLSADETTFSQFMENLESSEESRDEAADVLANQWPRLIDNVCDICDAAYIQAQGAGTVTHNLVVGIMDIAEPRKLFTKYKQWMELVRVYVGDETGSGFEIDWWSDPKQEPNFSEQFKRHDVILLKNIALKVFEPFVDGQRTAFVSGTNMRMARPKVWLLNRPLRSKNDKKKENEEEQDTTKDTFTRRQLDAVNEETAVHDRVRWKAKQARDWLLGLGFAPLQHYLPDMISQPPDSPA